MRLVQHVLYQELGPTRRARAHRQVAEALEELCGHDPGPRVGELAHHWFHATQLVRRRKGRLLLPPGRTAALDALAPVDAVRYFLQALELLDQLPVSDPTLEIDLVIDLGIAQRQAGMADFRETLLKAARRARPSGTGIGSSGRPWQQPGPLHRPWRDRRGEGRGSRVGTAGGSRAGQPRACPAARHSVLELSYGPLDRPRRLALAHQTLEMAERLADPATLVDVVSLGLPLSIPSMLEQRRRATGRTVAMARDLDDPARLFWAVCFDRLNSPTGGRL